MIKRMIIKPLYQEKDTHIGSVVNFGFIHLPIHHELYLTKEIKQRFKFGPLPFKVNSSMVTFKLPLEIVGFMASALAQEDFSLIDLELFKSETMRIAKEMRDDARKKVLASEEVDQDTKQSVLANLKADEEHVEHLFKRLSKEEKTALASFTHSGYTLLFREGRGTTTTCYMARILDDRLSLYAVDLIDLKVKKLVTNVQSFYVTRRHMETFMQAIKEKGGDVL